MDAADLLEEALRLPSPSGEERAVAELLVARMASFADEAFLDAAGNAVGVVGSGPRTVTFLGHIDTYPGGPAVRREGELLYGRGAVDAKGPMCAAIAASARLSKAVRERVTLRLIGAVEEEAPSSRGARHALTVYPKPRLLIIGEPSGWQGITLGYKGRLLVRLESTKATAHSAGEEPSAADEVVAALRLIEDRLTLLNEGRTSPFKRVQSTVLGLATSLSGDRQVCSARLGFRLPPDLPPLRLQELIEELPLPERVDRHFSGQVEAVVAEKDNVLTRAFRSAIREAGGIPRHKFKTGTSDMNLVLADWQVPAVAYGPGDSTLDHTPDEHISVPELARAVEVLTGVLEKVAYAAEDSRPEGD